MSKDQYISEIEHIIRPLIPRAARWMREPPEDVSQEFWLLALEALRTYDPNRLEWSKYLRLIIARHVAKAVEQGNVRRGMMIPFTDAPCPASDPAGPPLAPPLGESLEAPLRIMTDGERQVFILRDIVGLSRAETATELGLSLYQVIRLSQSSRLKFRSYYVRQADPA